MMFVVKLKIKKKYVIAITAAISLAAVLLILLMSSGGKTPDDSATCDQIGKFSLVAQTTGGECGFLKQFGCSPIADSRKSETVIIPSKFNEIYDKYNALQKQIGLDLEPYKGREAQKVTYEIDNSNEKYAVLLTVNGRVIGAHLTNGEYGDENKPLI